MPAACIHSSFFYQIILLINYALWPHVAAKRFNKMEWYEKALIVLQSPMIVLLRISVPVVSSDLPKDGWSRSVTSMQASCSLMPQALEA